MILKVGLPKDEYEALIRSFRTLEKSEESVLKTAVNRTAQKTQRILAKKVQENYAGEAARQSKVLEKTRIRKATTSSVAATIIVSSPAHEVKDFHVSGLVVRSPYTKSGKRSTKRPRGNVKKGQAKKFDDGFVVKFHSGHIAVVSRMKGITARKFAGLPPTPHREKLRVWYSPSKSSMAKNVYDADEISDRLYKEVEAVMAKVLGG